MTADEILAELTYEEAAALKYFERRIDQPRVCVDESTEVARGARSLEAKGLLVRPRGSRMFDVQGAWTHYAITDLGREAIRGHEQLIEALLHASR